MTLVDFLNLRRTRSEILILSGLGLLCLLSYSNSFYPVFQYDDIRLIRFNFSLRDLSQWESIFRFEPFRPLPLATFALNFAISGKDTFSYHVVNLLLHFCNVAAFFVLLRRTTGNLFFCGISAALMAAHPINTESVTYISSRSVLLCSLFYLLSLITFDSYVRMLRGYLIPVCVAFFFLAAVSKEEAIIIPFALFLYNFLFFGRGSVRKHRVFHFCTFMIAVAAAFVRLKFISLSFPISPLNYFPTEVNVWLRYLWLMIYPVNLNVDHSIRALTFSHPQFPVSACFVLLVALQLWRMRTKHTILSFWGFWFFLNLLPSSILPLNDFMAEHRTYISAFGFCASLGYLIIALQKQKRPYIIYAVLILQVILFSAQTLLRNRVWSNELWLWSDAVKKSPGKVRPHLNLAGALLRNFEFDEAIREYELARALNRGLPGPYNGLGFCYLNQAKLDEAETNFRIALQKDPDFEDSKTGLGIVLYRQEKYAEALHYFTQVYPRRQESIQLIQMMTESFVKTGEYEQAVQLIQRAIELEPSNSIWQLRLNEARKRLAEKRESE